MNDLTTIPTRLLLAAMASQRDRVERLTRLVDGCYGEDGRRRRSRGPALVHALKAEHLREQTVLIELERATRAVWHETELEYRL